MIRNWEERVPTCFASNLPVVCSQSKWFRQLGQLRSCGVVVRMCSFYLLRFTRRVSFHETSMMMSLRHPRSLYGDPLNIARIF